MLQRQSFKFEKRVQEIIRQRQGFLLVFESHCLSGPSGAKGCTSDAEQNQEQLPRPNQLQVRTGHPVQSLIKRGSDLFRVSIRAGLRAGYCFRGAI